MLPTIIVFIVVLGALIIDVKERRIPNLLTFGGTIAGIVLHIIESGWTGLADGLLGWAVGIGLLLIPFLLGGMGAGDVKLLGTIGALMGAHFVFYTMLWTAFAGGLLSIIYLLYQRKIFTAWMTTRTTSEKFMPYGAAIFAGTVIELSRMIGWIG
jgi:prepilin peptidase CpaA